MSIIIYKQSTYKYSELKQEWEKILIRKKVNAKNVTEIIDSSKRIVFSNNYLFDINKCEVKYYDNKNDYPIDKICTTYISDRNKRKIDFLFLEDVVKKNMTQKMFDRMFEVCTNIIIGKKMFIIFRRESANFFKYLFTSIFAGLYDDILYNYYRISHRQRCINSLLYMGTIESKKNINEYIKFYKNNNKRLILFCDFDDKISEKNIKLPSNGFIYDPGKEETVHVSIDPDEIANIVLSSSITYLTQMRRELVSVTN